MRGIGVAKLLARANLAAFILPLAMKFILLPSLLLIAGPIVSAPACEKSSAATAPATRSDSMRMGENNSTAPAAALHTTPPPRDRRAQPKFLFM